MICLPWYDESLTVKLSSTDPSSHSTFLHVAAWGSHLNTAVLGNMHVTPLRSYVQLMKRPRGHGTLPPPFLFSLTAKEENSSTKVYARGRGSGCHENSAADKNHRHQAPFDDCREFTQWTRHTLSSSQESNTFGANRFHFTWVWKGN